MKQTKGLYPAPLKIAEVLEKSAEVGFGTDAAYKIEAEGFGQLTMEPVTKAMINIFNARTHCGKNHWGKPEQPPKELGKVFYEIYCIDFNQNTSVGNKSSRSVG